MDNEKAKKQAEYQRKYENKRVIKKVSFNTEKETDLLDFANSVDFSNWVKQKIQEELKNSLQKI